MPPDLLPLFGKVVSASYQTPAVRAFSKSVKLEV
jgi:hypothetical protein